MKKLVRLARKIGLGRAVCLVMLAGLVMLRVWDPLPLRVVRLRTFDFYQRMAPFQPKIHPVVIADIDERSLKTYGQWPWPRTLLAALVTKLTKLGAAAIGFDVMFPEADRMSPAHRRSKFPWPRREHPCRVGEAAEQRCGVRRGDPAHRGSCSASRGIISRCRTPAGHR